MMVAQDRDVNVENAGGTGMHRRDEQQMGEEIHRNRNSEAQFPFCTVHMGNSAWPSLRGKAQ